LTRKCSGTVGIDLYAMKNSTPIGICGQVLGAPGQEFLKVCQQTRCDDGNHIGSNPLSYVSSFLTRIAGVLALGTILALPVQADEVALISRLAPSIRSNVIEEAVGAMKCAQSRGVGVNARRLAIIDYTIPSRQQRMWVLDLEAEKLLFEEHVAHGKKSGHDIPKVFSNRVGSHQTSLGLFLTDATYHGANGYSLKLHGLSKGFNEAAMRRLIVMHGAAYVDPRSAARVGRLGRSWGCPAVRVDVARPMIDALKEGNFIYSHGPGTSSLSQCGTESLTLASLAD